MARFTPSVWASIAECAEDVDDLRTVKGVCGLARDACRCPAVLAAVMFRHPSLRALEKIAESARDSRGAAGTLRRLAQMGMDLDRPRVHWDAVLNTAIRCTPLTYAVTCGNEAAVVAFLKAGSDPNGTRLAECAFQTETDPKDRDDVSQYELFALVVKPMDAAAYLGHAHLMKRLIEAGGAVDPCRGGLSRPLYLACQRGHLETAKLLLDQPGAHPDSSMVGGWTPLMVAADEGHQAIVRLLVERGADLSFVDGTGHTALARACIGQRLGVVRELLRAGASTSLRGPDAWTPLFSSAYLGHAGSVSLLCDAGAQVDATVGGLYTPLLGACQCGHAGIAHELIAAGANVEARSQQGFTPLMVASTMGHRHVVQVLLAHGANPVADEPVDAREARTTPLALAIERGHVDIAYMISCAQATQRERWRTNSKF